MADRDRLGRGSPGPMGRGGPGPGGVSELGGGSREPGGESYFHTLVMRGGSLEGSGRERVLEGFCWDR